MREKICANPECNKIFKSKRKDALFCSKNCVIKVWRTTHSRLEEGRRYRAKHKDELKAKGVDRHKKFRETHPDYGNAWFRNHPEQKLSYQRKYRKSHPVPHRNDNAKFRKNNPDVIRAQNKANREIKIPQGELCTRCGIALATDKHHPDYSKPLEVQFVCEKCHVILDKERIG